MHYPGSKAHGKKCTHCGRKFCSPKSPRRTCGRPTCSSNRVKHGAIKATATWPHCQVCRQRINPARHHSKSHNQVCVICKKKFCPGRPGGSTTCSSPCNKELQSRINKARWQRSEYRLRQSLHNSRSHQAGKESAEAREIRGLLGLKQAEIPKFGYRWDGAWPRRRLFWEHQGCCWHYCRKCGFDHKFKDGGKEVIAKRRSDLKKRRAAESHGWSVFYTWSHDLSAIRKDPKGWFLARLGWSPSKIELLPHSIKKPRLCSRKGCNQNARPGRSTCSDRCYHKVRADGAARLNRQNAVTNLAKVCERPGCGQMVFNQRYHNIACKGCGRRFCVKNQSNPSAFHSLKCYFRWMRSQAHAKVLAA